MAKLLQFSRPSNGVRNVVREWWVMRSQKRRRKRDSASGAPNAPANLTLADVSNWIQLTWQDMSSNEQGFRVYRKVDGGSFGLWLSLGANSTTTNDAGVLVGHVYAYYVTAYNAVGESAPSNTASETYGT
jgi:hypothetical protein